MMKIRSASSMWRAVAKLDKNRWSCPAGVAPGIFRRGLTLPTRGLALPTRGLKYGFQGTINAKNLQKSLFTFRRG